MLYRLSYLPLSREQDLNLQPSVPGEVSLLYTTTSCLYFYGEQSGRVFFMDEVSLPYTTIRVLLLMHWGTCIGSF